MVGTNATPVEHVHDNNKGGDDVEPTDDAYVMGNVVLARTQGEFLTTLFTSHADNALSLEVPPASPRAS